MRQLVGSVAGAPPVPSSRWATRVPPGPRGAAQHSAARSLTGLGPCVKQWQLR